MHINFWVPNDAPIVTVADGDYIRVVLAGNGEGGGVGASVWVKIVGRPLTGSGLETWTALAECEVAAISPEIAAFYSISKCCAH